MPSKYFEQWLQATTDPRQIMLVEDSPADCQIILSGSKDFHIDWTVVHTYQEALEALERGDKKFRLIVLDLQLQSSPDGVALFRHIKREWPWIPVLVLSGYITDHAISEMTSVGFVMFAKKPNSYDTRFFGELFFALNIPKKSGTEIIRKEKQ